MISTSKTHKKLVKMSFPNLTLKKAQKLKIIEFETQKSLKLEFSSFELSGVLGSNSKTQKNSKI